MALSIEHENELKRFRTYVNYLNAADSHYRSTYGNLETYYAACEAATRKLQGNRLLDVEYVRKHYKLGWNTEHLLYASRNDDADVQRLSNHWAPVQAYYSVYCASEATVYALCGQQFGSHSGALNQITDYVAKCNVTPWCWVATGALGKSRRDHRLENFPQNVVVPNNLQRQDVDPNGMLARCLLAEHKNRVDDKWQRGAGRKYAFDPGDTGLLHFLYRLRVKANYDNVEMFLVDGGASDISAFPILLSRFAMLAMIYLETITMRRIKKRVLVGMAKDYLDRNNDAVMLKRRLDLYEQ